MDQTLTSHVEALHNKALIIDAHLDLPLDLIHRRERGQEKVIETHYLDRFRKGGVNLVVAALFIEDYFLPELALRRALDQISYLLREIEESSGALRICKTTDDIVQAKQNDQVGIMLSFEGAEPLQQDLHLLRIFYELGVRGIGLTWSRRNYVGDGAYFSNIKEGRKGGLTNFGVNVIEAAEALGMFVDVSHLNDEGFWDVMEVAQKPVIASHSNCRALKDSKRNLTDQQIEALVGKGGVIGMNAAAAFIGDISNTKEQLTIEQLLDHVDHIVKIAGIEHVGLGLDLCDQLENYLTLEKNLNSYDVVGGHQHVHKITSGLIRRGYSDENILRILGRNFMRVFEETL